jgi:hypothetical protein
MLDLLNFHYCSTDHFDEQSTTNRLLTAGSVLGYLKFWIWVGESIGVWTNSNSKAIHVLLCAAVRTLGGSYGWVSYDAINLEFLLDENATGKQ